MSINILLSGDDFNDQLRRTGAIGNTSASRSPLDAETISAAMTRLKSAAKQSRRQRQINAEVYYGAGSRLEETIEGVSTDHNFDAVVTRNHYGSLVLNAHRALFIDVDVAAEEIARNHTVKFCRKHSTIFASFWEAQGRRFSDLPHCCRFLLLRLTGSIHVLRNQNQLMKTAAPTRILSNCAFAQNTFRAPPHTEAVAMWHGSPPFVYPRVSLEHECCFETWLLLYEHRCQERATCQFLARWIDTDSRSCRIDRRSSRSGN